MKVLITGSSGFFGRYILLFFNALNYKIDTIGRAKENSIISDISKQMSPLKESYDLVVHAAGKAHIVPKNKENKKDFYDVNLQGTTNLLNALSNKPKYFVFISSVSVYGLDYGEMINEDTILKAKDPYGRSKILAEQAVLDWGNLNNVIITILRIPLLFGHNAPGNLGAMINAVKKGYYFNIGKGDASKSMVLAEDVVKFIPRIIQKGGTYNLTDGYHPNFKELSFKAATFFNNKKPITINYYLVLFLANIGSLIQLVTGRNFPINKRKFSKMTNTLTFNDDRARANGWKPLAILNNTDRWLK